MRYPGLNLLHARQRRIMWVADDVDECNAVQTDHLLEVHVAVVVAVHVISADTEVRAVRVRLEDIAPCWRRRVRDGDVQEHGLGGRLEYRVRMLIELKCWWEHARGKRASIEGDLEVKRMALGLVLRIHNQQVLGNSLRATDLSNDEVLRELSESNDVVEKFPLPRVEVRSTNQLERIVDAEVPLVALLDLVALADDLVWVDAELDVARPRAITHILVNTLPASAVVPSIPTLDVTSLTETVATTAAAPNEVIALDRVEVQDLKTEGIRWQGCFEGIPSPAKVGRIVVLCRGCKEVRAIGGERVMIEGDELLSREKLRPRVTFIGGLPDSMVGETNKDGLRRMSTNHCHFDEVGHTFEVLK